VVSAVNAQSLTLASGDAKMGKQQFLVRVNAMPLAVDALNHLPIKQVGQRTVYLSDVAHVTDEWAVQQNIVHAGGKHAVLLTIIRNGDASTLDVVNRVKAAGAHNPESGAAWRADQHAVWPVGVRPAGDRKRAARGCYRRGALLSFEMRTATCQPHK
jgi:hypothetical protein